MEKLFDLWSRRTPNYSKKYDVLFDKLAFKGNTAKDEETIELRGKIFDSYYEFYIYAFFLGLYSTTKPKLVETGNSTNFGHSIENWGRKSHAPNRSDFTLLQQYIFSIVILKSDLDFIALEREFSENEISKYVSKLIGIMEAYTNSGLELIGDIVERDPNYFFRSEIAPLNEILKYCSIHE